ncbi:uncharacterized protein LOC100891166 [Strongylocentrotus purpuratus]|uniref:BZIP domain-containing protein n=1 Tax=Strongylocentrotus purpuratus TaxID=7668 RepID=A0A7M7GHT9_STRPU|nr:uncharacterized protein LOC100891166 [Strongylocentrotus purpuratus]XP_030829062.1 uncharacterized protein LOC100891166 [Strongylocentrotus purpuratus]XP_030829063.1 uncharacterized protein LOC100891166 [Strongylocentrotus purpuratus]
MASQDDTYCDFSDMAEFINDPPISGFPASPEYSPLFEPPDTNFFDEDEEAVMGLKSHQQPCGSVSPSTSSYTSDYTPETPLSRVAETALFCQQRELETGQAVYIDSSNPFYMYSELLDQLEQESGDLVRGGNATSQKEQTSSGAVAVHPVDIEVSPSTKSAFSTTAAGREQTSQKVTVNALGVKSTSQPSSRPTVNGARGSSHVRENKNNLPVAKNDVIKVGVKRKAVQVKEEAKKVKKSCEDSATTSRSQKNAIAARENRLKKKNEFEEMKRNEALLQEENECLRKENSDQLKTITGLQQKVEYLKSVLFNQSSLSTVLQSLNPKPKLKLSSSVGVSSQVDGAQRMSGGVCLHINGSSDASLEWCSKCSMKAQASFDS